MKRLLAVIGILTGLSGICAAETEVHGSAGGSSFSTDVTVSNVSISTVGVGDSTNADYGLEIEYYKDHVFKLCGADPAVAGARLKVYSVAVATHPTEVASLGLSAFQTGPQSSDVQGHIMWILGYEAVTTTRALVAVDISTPNAPTVIASVGVSLPDRGYQIRVAGHYAYCGFNTPVSSNVFRIVDIAVASAPVVLAGSELSTLPGIVNGLDVRDGIVTLCFENNGSNAVRQIDVHDPRHPVIMNSTSVNSPSEPRQVVVQGALAFTGSYFETTGLIVLNLSTPSTPVLVSTTATPNPVLSIFGFGHYVAVGMQDFYGDGQTCQVFEVSNPAAPRLVKTFTIHTNVSGFAGHGRYLYIGGRATADCLFVVDMGEVITPAVVAGQVEAGNLNVRNQAVFDKDLTAASVAVGGGGLLVQAEGAFTGTVSAPSYRLLPVAIVGITTPTASNLNTFYLSTNNGLVYSTGTGDAFSYKRVGAGSITTD